MRKIIIFIVTLTGITLCQDKIPLEVTLKTRIVNNSTTLVNIQLTNLIDKPLDYVEGFVREINSDKVLITEKRMVLIYHYEPALQTGFSTTKTTTYDLIEKNPPSFQFNISKVKFDGENRVFAWHPKSGFIRID